VSPKSNNSQKKDLIIVLVVLGLLFGVNYTIFKFFNDEVETNYFIVGTTDVPSPTGLYGIVALERNFTGDQYSIELHDSNGTRIIYDVIQCWATKDGKYLHFSNFTAWEDPNENETYRFFLNFRSKYSEPVKYSPEGYFYWATNSSVI
jgi:hypothetical protein